MPTQEIVRADGRVTLRVRFIEVPTDAEAPTTVRHGWMAFPSRPLPPGFRAVICGQGKGDYPSARNTHFWADADWAVLWPYYCSPFPWSMARSKDATGPQHAARRPGPSALRGLDRPFHRAVPGLRGPRLRPFAVDWGEMPGVIGNSDVTQSRGPIDFRLWHYRRWVREGGFRGLYIDENYLSFDRNPLTGGAYLRPDGRVQPGYTYTGLREYFKRMMVMFHQEGRPRPNLWQHISSGAAYHAWYGDVLMEGENVEPTNEEADYLAVLPAGRMRAIGSPVCNGSTTIMMCQSQRHRDAVGAEAHASVRRLDPGPRHHARAGPLVRPAGPSRPAAPRRRAVRRLLEAGQPGEDRHAGLHRLAAPHGRSGPGVDRQLGPAGSHGRRVDRLEGAGARPGPGPKRSTRRPARRCRCRVRGFSVPVLRRDFAAVLLVERRQLGRGPIVRGHLRPRAARPTRRSAAKCSWATGNWSPATAARPWRRGRRASSCGAT